MTHESSSGQILFHASHGFGRFSRNIFTFYQLFRKSLEERKIFQKSLISAGMFKSGDPNITEGVFFCLGRIYEGKILHSSFTCLFTSFLNIQFSMRFFLFPRKPSSSSLSVNTLMNSSKKRWTFELQKAEFGSFSENDGKIIRWVKEKVV